VVEGCKQSQTQPDVKRKVKRREKKEGGKWGWEWVVMGVQVDISAPVGLGRVWEQSLAIDEGNLRLEVGYTLCKVYFFRSTGRNYPYLEILAI
jgi:hypothetical protein